MALQPRRPQGEGADRRGRDRRPDLDKLDAVDAALRLRAGPVVPLAGIGRRVLGLGGHALHRPDPVVRGDEFSQAYSAGMGNYVSTGDGEDNGIGAFKFRNGAFAVVMEATPTQARAGASGGSSAPEE